MVKKQYSFILIIALIALVALALGKLPLSITGDNLVVPDWARYECQPTDTYEGYQAVPIPATGGSVYCGQNEFTDTCKVNVNVNLNMLVSTNIYYQTCNSDGTSCSANTIINYGIGNKQVTAQLPDLLAGKKYFIACKDANVIGKACSADKTYRIWGIYRYDAGTKYEVVAKDCTLTSGLVANVPVKETLPSGYKLTMTGGIGQKWIHYVSRWLTAPASLNVITYNGQKAYCTAGKVYALATVQTLNGATYYVSPDATTTDPDAPSYYTTIGAQLATVECCYPADPQCDSTFHFKTSPSNNTACFNTAQCLNSGDPIPKDKTHYYTQTCVNGVCTNGNLVTVECTNTGACQSGYICDLTQTNYGHCIKQNPTGCGNGVCDLEETYYTCPNDCNAPPACMIAGLPCMWVLWGIIIILVVTLIGGVGIWFKFRS